MIQNKLISVLAEEVFCDVKIKLQSAPFFATILDTTQDVSKKDQLSEVFRYVNINYHDDGTLSELKERLPHLSKFRIHLLLDCIN